MEEECTVKSNFWKILPSIRAQICGALNRAESNSAESLTTGRAIAVILYSLAESTCGESSFYEIYTQSAQRH
jgi:hypothetical protein